MSTSSVPIVTQYSQASQQLTQSDAGGGVARGVASGDVAGSAQLVEENDPRVAPNSNFHCYRKSKRNGLNVVWLEPWTEHVYV